MARSDLNDWEKSPVADPSIEAPTAARAPDTADADDEVDAEEPRYFEDPKRIAQTALLVALIVVAIYLLIPQIAGFEDGLAKLGEGSRSWLVIAFGFGLLMFASYVALFRGIVGERVRLNWGESYEVTMASLAATRLFSAGGAGGIVLTYWALRKAGMKRKETAARMVAFIVVLYAVYMLTLVINGALLRAGVFSGPAPAGLTVGKSVV